MRPIDQTPFDRHRAPPPQNLLAMPPLWAVAWLMTRPGRLRIQRERMEGLKPPFLVLGTHHSFLDFYVTPLALFPHRANYVSELEGFEHYGEWAYRQIGCLGTRKFVTDPALVRNIRRVMARGGILALYPEARYANVGTSSQLPPSVGKLVKLLGVPVVTLNMKGNYLQSPIWNLRRRPGVRLETTITQCFTAQELACTSTKEVQAGIQKALTYDEYAWQLAQGMEIDCHWRAEGLELPLYQCPVCNEEFQMASQGAELFCSVCSAHWHMDTLGRLEGPCFSHIPHWYEWERTRVIHAIDTGAYGLELPVHIEALPNAVNFIDLGAGTLRHGPEGFFLTLTEYGASTAHTFHFPTIATFSIHTEYDYRGKGQCITLSTPDNTYFIYPRGEGFNATKLQFATEHLHTCAMAALQNHRMRQEMSE